MLVLSIIAVGGLEVAARTAIVVLGYDPASGVNWERVVYGDPNAGLLGRVPQGVLLAERFSAELLVLGSGEISGARSGTEDPVAMLARRLPGLRAFGGTLARTDDLLARVLPNCVSERDAPNTREEIRRALALCAARGINLLVLVSSATHAPRCLRDACALLEADSTLRGERGRPLRVLACASDTSFTEAAGEGAGAVAIVEPPHRVDPGEDQAVPPLHQLVSRAVQLDSAGKFLLRVQLASLLDRLDNRVGLES
jgi:hypothetical protein